MRTHSKAPANPSTSVYTFPPPHKYNRQVSYTPHPTVVGLDALCSLRIWGYSAVSQHRCSRSRCAMFPPHRDTCLSAAMMTVTSLTTSSVCRPTGSTARRWGSLLLAYPRPKLNARSLCHQFGTSAHDIAGWPCVVDVIVPGFLKSFYIQLVMCPSFNSGDKLS